jgi:uncharacterized delta-60 repeat protein
MRILRAVLLVPVLLALLAGSALAKSPPTKPPAGVDKSFGTMGVAKIATGGASPEGAVRMALAPSGRVYALQGNLLLAFQASGRPARAFGNNGRVRVESTRGELKPTGLAVDSQGHVLVGGTIFTYPSELDPPIPADAKVDAGATMREAFVDRYLEDGSPDTSFGNGGESDTTFGLPRPTGLPGQGVEFERALVEATTLTIDPQDRPVVGGNYSSALYFCGCENEHPVPFVGRLTATGSLDTGYGGKGYVAGGEGRILGAAETPEGGVATLSGARSCGPRSDALPSVFDSLTEDGDQNPALDPARPTMYTRSSIAVDSKGRALLTQFDDPFTEDPVKLLRLLPGGAVDTSFGFGGGVPLVGDVTSPGAIAIDAKDRTVVAGSGIEHPDGPRLVRYTVAGKRDRTFGDKGLLQGPIADDKRGAVEAVAIDGKGRIYAAGWVESKTLKTGHGIQITRFLAN